jgi:hypothetical protein
MQNGSQADRLPGALPEGRSLQAPGAKLHALFSADADRGELRRIGNATLTA